MIEGLLDYLVTDEDRALVVEELDSLSRAYYQHGSSQDTRVPLIPIASMMPTYTTQTLDEIRREVADFEVIYLTIAIVPSREFLKKMIDLVRRTLQKSNVVIHVETVITVSAGVIFSRGGKLDDRSLSKKILKLSLAPIIEKRIPILAA